MQNYAEIPQTTQLRHTLAGVLGEKLIAYVRANKTGRILRKLAEVVAALILGVLVLYPAEVLSALDSLLKLNNFAIPKVSIVASAFLGRRSIIRMFKRCAKFVHSFSLQHEKLLDGIPVVELSDFMIRNKHFKREGVNGVRETFGLNMEKFNKLASKLEANGVLTRGENNGRILDTKWSRQSLIDYLSGTQKSADMEPRFKIHRIGAGAKIRLDREEFATA